MKTVKPQFVLAFAFCALIAGRDVRAGVVTFTSSSDYNAAVAGIAGGTTTVEDYNSLATGQTIANGSTVDGLTYQFQTTNTLTGGIITNQFNSISGQSLGGNQSIGAQFFFDGDQFTVTFAQPVYSVGLFFNVNLNSGTYGLTTSVGSASTGSASYDQNSFIHNTFVFAGLVSTTSFTSATFFSTSGGNGTATYNVPEITYTTVAGIGVPEPSSLMLGGIGGTLGVAALLFRRRV